MKVLVSKGTVVCVGGEVKYKDLVLPTRGPVPRKMIKFNPGLSQILSKVFLSKNMQLKLSKYCWVSSEIQ